MALLVMPTGTGKTEVGIACAQQADGRILVLTHRDIIADQWESRLRKNGFTVGREQAFQWADQFSFWGDKDQAIVSTVQTQNSAWNGVRRMERYSPGEFALVIADECHRSAGITWKRALAHHGGGNGTKILGMTATPSRHDEKSLIQIFGEPAYLYEPDDAIDDGWLVPLRQYPVHIESLDLSVVKSTAGDLNAAELAAEVERKKVLAGMADAVFRLAGRRKTLIFTVRVKHAELLTEILNDMEWGCARSVSAKMPHRDRKLLFEDYTAGEFRFLSNVGIVSEGLDIPAIEVVAMARPTESWELYAQMLGRGLRPLAGIVDAIPDGNGQLLLGEPSDPAACRRLAIAQSTKPFLEVIDFVGNAGRHTLMCSLDAMAGKYSDEELDLARTINKSGGMRDPRQDLETARKRLQEQKERDARRPQVTARAVYHVGAHVDPFRVLGVRRDVTYGWGRDADLTEKQMKLLTRFGVPTEGLSKAQAGRLIGECIQRRKNGRCTYRQSQVLQRFGYSPNTSFADASRLLDRLIGKKKES